jgi:hypothetical protein
MVGQNASGSGMGVNMGIELFQQVPLGEKYPLERTLIVSNNSDNAGTFVLSTVKPSTGLGTTLGYSDLPELGWITFDKNEIRISPNSRDSIHIYLMIPKQDEYYNQHWSVYVSVAGKPGSGSISLACYPKILIETESKSDPKQKNNGLLGLEPSVVEFGSIHPGKPNLKKIRIYNNSDKKQIYHVSILGNASCLEKRINPTPDHAWILDPDRIVLYTGKLSSGRSSPFTVKLYPNKSLSLRLKVSQLKDEQYKRWEGIILVESDQGFSNFVRVYIEPDSTIKDVK